MSSVYVRDKTFWCTGKVRLANALQTIQLFMERTFPYRTTIEIDCDPWTGMGRQENHYKAACEAAGLEPQPIISTCFGCWTWPVEYQSQEQQNIVKEYLTDLYNRGLVRYASW